MGREEIIKEVITRFKLDSRSIKNLEEYEYDLIHEQLSSIDPKHINESIKDFNNKKFKIKSIRTAFTK